MKKNSFFALILILATGLLYNSWAQPIEDITVDLMKDEELLLEAIEVGGFQVEEVNINKSTLISNKFFTIEELDEKKLEIMDALKIEGEVVHINVDEIYHNNYMEDPLDIESEYVLEQRVVEDGYNEIIVFVPKEDGNVTVIKLLSTKVMGEIETYFLVDRTENKGYKEIVDNSNIIDDILAKHGTKVETTINLTGAHLGELTKSEKNQKQEAIFSFLKAKKIEVLEEELFTSITSYSPLISSYIEYGNNKVNLQLAMRYSAYEDKTYIWISNPLITITY